jgi:hypothetical protein
MNTRTEPEETPFVIGIDPSIAGTCVCLGTSPKNYRMMKFPSKPTGRSLRARVARIEDTVARVMQWIGEAPERVGHPYPMLLIEGYSFGSKQGGEYLAEYGGLLRFHLVDDFDAFEVAPTQLKKYITGKGSGKKELMIAHLAQKHGAIFDSNDHYDAYGLFLMALGAIKAIPVTKEQQAAIDAVLKTE